MGTQGVVAQWRIQLYEHLIQHFPECIQPNEGISRKEKENGSDAVMWKQPKDADSQAFIAACTTSLEAVLVSVAPSSSTPDGAITPGAIDGPTSREQQRIIHVATGLVRVLVEVVDGVPVLLRPVMLRLWDTLVVAPDASGAHTACATPAGIVKWIQPRCIRLLPTILVRCITSLAPPPGATQSAGAAHRLVYEVRGACFQWLVTWFGVPGTVRAAVDEACGPEAIVALTGALNLPLSLKAAGQIIRAVRDDWAAGARVG